MNRDQGYHLPDIYNQIIPPKYKRTHVLSVREQGPSVADGPKCRTHRKTNFSEVSQVIQ